MHFMLMFFITFYERKKCLKMHPIKEMFCKFYEYKSCFVIIQQDDLYVLKSNDLQCMTEI